MLTVANVSNHTKNCIVFKTHIDLWATLQTARGLEVCDVILGGPEQHDETW